MKKRIFSVLLSVCMVISMLAAMPGTALAAGTIEHTLKAGETVYSVCQNYGIDFWANYDWITKTNNITSYGNVKAGTKIILPAPSATVATVNGTTVLVDSSKDKTLMSGDYVSGYLVAYSLKAGETVFAVCNGLGVKFDDNAEMIKKLSGIQNFNNLKVGQKVIVPTMAPPASGVYYKVVAHKVQAGDTAGAICRSYGIDYSSNESLLKVLNNRENLGAIKAGSIFYLPVPASASTASPTKTGTGTGTGTVAVGTNTANAHSVSTSNHGSYYLTVNGKLVNSARAGEKVTIVTMPDVGYKLSYITVSAVDAPINVTVSNGSFTMPDYEVVVTVVFRAA